MVKIMEFPMENWLFFYRLFIFSRPPTGARKIEFSKSAFIEKINFQ